MARSVREGIPEDSTYASRQVHVCQTYVTWKSCQPQDNGKKNKKLIISIYLILTFLSDLTVLENLPDLHTKCDLLTVLILTKISN